MTSPGLDVSFTMMNSFSDMEMDVSLINFDFVSDFSLWPMYQQLLDSVTPHVMHYGESSPDISEDNMNTSLPF